MTLCINPVCPAPNNPDNNDNRFCKSCGSHLKLLERYRVRRLLSDKTGFGQVYEIYEQDTPKILKVLKHDFSNDARAVKSFQHEASVLGQINHPGIPQIDTYFQYQTRNSLVLHCIVMEKINGSNLEQYLQQQNYSISQDKAINWLKQLTEILDLLHSKLYLHRDIKPSNIMIRPNGQLVLIDFGTAEEITKTSQTQLGENMIPIMSSGYSAPEQMSGEATLQSDFFSLGRTFVFLLTGKHPLDMYDVRNNSLNWQKHTNNISPSLLSLIDWLMAPDIKKRPHNAQDILQNLADIEQQNLAKTPTINLPNPPTEQSTQPQLHSPLPLLVKQSDKLPLFALFAALLVSLGLLSLLALATAYPKFALLLTATQSPERKGKIDYFPYEEGRDSQGRVAEFNIAVLSVEYKWLVGSNFQIKYNDKIISLDLLKLNLEQEGIQKIMEEPSEIISVGTSACEGSKALQERRALERSKQIQILAKKLFRNTSSVKKFRILNVGQFQQSNCQSNQDLTAYQRSVIIIGVKNKSNSVILDEALRNRLEKKPFADFRLKDYSLGSVDKFQTIPNE